MAISNRDKIGRGLENLRAGLAPFVERELKARLRGDWRSAVERGSRYEMRRDAGGDIVWDTSALFSAMLGQWDDVFRYTLGPPQRSLVHEIRGVRNDWAHEQTFSTDQTYRALDSMKLLLAGRLRRRAGPRAGAPGHRRPAHQVHRAGSHRGPQGRGREWPAAGRTSSLARGHNPPRGRLLRPLRAGRVRRRPRPGLQGRGRERVPRPPRVLPPHLPHRGSQAPPRQRPQAPLRRGRRPRGGAPDQLRRRQDPLHARPLPPLLRHPRLRPRRRRATPAWRRCLLRRQGQQGCAGRHRALPGPHRHQARRDGRSGRYGARWPGSSAGLTDTRW